MEKIYVGYVQGVHGLRGDLKVKNKFESPERIFKKGNIIYLNDEKHEITQCKYYKGFYLVTIDNVKNINLVEKYIGYDVFIDRENLNLKDGEFLFIDLLNMDIVDNDNYGKVIETLDNGQYKLLKIKGGSEFLIPFVDRYIDRVDIDSKIVYCKNIEELIL